MPPGAAGCTLPPAARRWRRQWKTTQRKLWARERRALRPGQMRLTNEDVSQATSLGFILRNLPWIDCYKKTAKIGK